MKFSYEMWTRDHLMETSHTGLLPTTYCKTLSFKWWEIEWGVGGGKRQSGEREGDTLNLRVLILVLVRLKLGKEQ